eukprot:gene51560-21429_t
MPVRCASWTECRGVHPEPASVVSWSVGVGRRQGASSVRGEPVTPYFYRALGATGGQISLR